MPSIDLFNGTPLLVLAVTALLLGAAMILAPFLGVGSKRKDPALASIMSQISAHRVDNAPLRETYIAEIVDEPAQPAPATRR